jgi:hypothetical protein
MQWIARFGFGAISRMLQLDLPPWKVCQGCLSWLIAPSQHSGLLSLFRIPGRQETSKRQKKAWREYSSDSLLSTAPMSTWFLIRTGSITPQYHVVFDGIFSTTMVDVSSDYDVTLKVWHTLLDKGGERHQCFDEFDEELPRVPTFHPTLDIPSSRPSTPQSIMGIGVQNKIEPMVKCRIITKSQCISYSGRIGDIILSS